MLLHQVLLYANTNIQAKLPAISTSSLQSMEPVGFVSDASWSSFDPPVPVDESEVMEQFFGSHNFANEQDQDPSTLFWPDHNADSYYCSANSSYSSYYWSQGNCTFMPGNYESFSLVEPPRMIPVDSHHRFGEPICANKEASSDEVAESIAKPLLHIAHGSQATKRKMHVGDVEEAREDSDSQMGTKPQKKARVTKKGNNAKPKKAQRSAGAATEDESNASYSYSSEDDSNGSQELKEVGGMSSCLNQNGKKRAGRGSATDPQSLYARKRRERINERLKVLQNLVPNGTKVDISTMLEEAVQYVKFLQLQIKLLSSDELWMYAPIAYNGMNLGFNLNIPK